MDGRIDYGNYLLSNIQIIIILEPYQDYEQMNSTGVVLHILQF